METNQGELRVYNPNKEISREVVLNAILWYRDACKQADTGEIFGSEEQIGHMEKRFNQVRGLTLIILSMKHLITISTSVIIDKSESEWKNKHGDEEKQKQNPFETFDCDYNEIMELKKILSFCQKAIINADKTKTLDDDFMIEKVDNKGEKYNELTVNFYEMRDDLDEIYVIIYRILMRNKIVSSGKEEDEELTNKQKETEAVRRIIEA